MKKVILALSLLGAVDGAFTLRGAKPLIEDVANAAAEAVAERTKPTAAKHVTVRDSTGKQILAGSSSDLNVDSVQEAAKAKAADGAKKMIASHMEKMNGIVKAAQERAAVENAEKEAAKAKAAEGAKKMMASHVEKMNGIVKAAQERAAAQNAASA